jgi:hypothetical protein
MTTQWHPLFAKLLRPIVESHYELKTNVPVGDAPRSADLLLLQRTTAGPLPFRGLWTRLTTWNIVEFKGPTVSARIRDLDLLVELGLGIDRRLNEEPSKDHLPPLAPGEVSFWYIVNRLGRRFLREGPHRLGPLEACGSGLWRCWVLGRLLYLVSSVELAVDEDSLPLHILAREPPTLERAVAQLVMQQRALWEVYLPVLAGLHEETWHEVAAMGRAIKRDVKLNLEGLAEYLDVQHVIQVLGTKRLIEEMGPKRLIEEMGPKRLIEEVGADWFLSHLTPAQRRELKQRLK